MQELLYEPIGVIAAQIRNGKVSAREVTDAALSRISAVDNKVNAFTFVDHDGARAQADTIGANDQRPFAGVPIAVKDLFTPVAGWPQSQGSEFFKNFQNGHDCAVVRRLREAGFVLIGLTNSPEFGILPVTEPRRFGPTRNPWDLTRTPGGSSGGAGAAVAAGMVPVAHGSDGGGSIRIPAACCGLVGLKPSRGRISYAPDLGEQMLATSGALTRTVLDSAQMLDVLAGYESGDANWAPPPSDTFANLTQRQPGKLKLGLNVTSQFPSPLDPLCVQAAYDAAGQLEALGHTVEEFELHVPAEVMAAFMQLWTVLIGSGVKFGVAVNGREPTDMEIEPLTRALYEQAKVTNSLSYTQAVMGLQFAARYIVQQATQFDAVLTPALGQRPLKLGELDACSADPMEDFMRSAFFTPFTAIWNLTGQPAIALPLYHGEDGLPLAVQLIGHPAGEGNLLALAHQIEQAYPWHNRQPPLL